MKKLRVVQIGTGHDHATGTMSTIRRMNEYFDVLGICEPDEILKEKAQKNDIYKDLQWFSLDDVLKIDNLDAVFIETTEKTSVKTAQIFADSGIHIHMDKPGGENYEDFEKLVNTMKEKNLCFHMGYMYRYNEGVKFCRDAVKSGKLGEIFSVETQMSVRHSKQKREWLSQFKGGMMFFLGCHMVDLVYTMCGQPDEVIPFNRKTGTDGVDAEDYGFALFKYKNGVSFVKTNAAEVNGYIRRQLVICGTKGTIEMYPIEINDKFGTVSSKMKVTYYEDGQNEWFECGENVEIGPFARYDTMMKDFYEIIAGGKKNEFSYEHELAVQKLVLKSCGYKI